MHSLKNLLPFIKLFKSQLEIVLLGVGLSFLAILSSIALMSLSGWFIAYTGYLATSSFAIAGSFNYFFPSGGVRTFSLSRIMTRYGERFYSHEATFKILTDIRVWFYKKLEPLAPSHLAKYKSGDLLSRLVNDVGALENLYVRIISPSCVLVLSIFAITILFAFLSLKLALMIFIFLTIAGVVIPFISYKLTGLKAYELNENQAELKTSVVEHIHSLAELKIFDLDNHHLQKIDNQNKKFLDTQFKLSFISGFSSLMMSLIMGISIVASVMMAVYLVSQWQMNGAFITLVALAIMAVFEAIMPIPNAYQYLGKVLSATKRINKIVDTKADVIYPNNDIEIKNATIEFENINFNYGKKNIFENLNLKIKDNERLSIFAPTGTGKTTLINLLARFYEPQQGSIKISGENIKNFSERSLRDTMTVIDQKSYIFNRSIRDNLLLAKPHANEEELLSALEKVGLKEFVLFLDKGLDTWTGEYGKHLSGGQQKRLTLARAFLQDKPILVLDEPTEGLDKVTEQKVFANLLELMENKTTILITHNKKLLDKMDRVVYL